MSESFHPSSPRTRQQREKEGPSRIEQAPSDDEIEDHLSKSLAGVRNLRLELSGLRRKVASLKNEQKAAQDASVQGLLQRRRQSQQSLETDDDTSLAELQVEGLKKTIKELKMENRRQQKRIEKLKAKQLEEEVNDLQIGYDKFKSGDEIDPMFRMRKLLRKFSDLMLTTTIAGDVSERCPVCFDIFTLENCSALSCGHIICNVCLPMISKGADETIKCPECRRSSPREELELVHWTEQGRWDALLEVAKAYDAFDTRGEQETSEEEAEENFITDWEGTSSFASEGGNDTSITTEDASSDAVLADIDNEDGSDKAPSPRPGHRQSFSQSPMKHKRKVMEQLAEERASKKRK